MASALTLPEGVLLRPMVREDIPAILRLIDLAIIWLVEQGRPGQWGTEPRSKHPETIKQVNVYLDSGGCWVAVDEKAAAAAAAAAATPADFESSGESPLTIINGVIGAMSIGKPHYYAPPATEPEVYVTLMIVDREQIGRGIGKLLIEKVRALAMEAGVGRIRVDCYRGDDGKLVKQYERYGFEKLEEADLPKPNGSIWPAQYLIQRLQPEAATTT